MVRDAMDPCVCVLDQDGKGMLLAFRVPSSVCAKTWEASEKEKEH